MCLDVHQQPGAIVRKRAADCFHHFGRMGHVMNAIERTNEIEGSINWSFSGVRKGDIVQGLFT